MHTTNYEIIFANGQRDGKVSQLFERINKIFIGGLKKGEYEYVKYKERFEGDNILGKFTAEVKQKKEKEKQGLF